MIGEFLDAAKEETISALRAELARLQQSQHAQQAADSALASLQQKIDSLQVQPPTCNLTAVNDHCFAFSKWFASADDFRSALKSSDHRI